MTKSERKLEAFFWFLIQILPLLLYSVVMFRVGVEAIPFADFISSYRFEFVVNILESIFSTAEIFAPSVVLSYISYFVSVELTRLFVCALLFFVKFPRRVLENFYAKIS